MTPKQAGNLAGLLFAAYPRPEPGESTFAVYVNRLTKLDYEPALTACEQLVDQPGRRNVPTPGEVREAYEAACRRRVIRTVNAPALPIGPHRLPATPDQAWTIEGARWALDRTLPDGMTEAELAEAEADAERAFLARGTDSKSRVESLRAENGAQLDRLIAAAGGRRWFGDRRRRKTPDEVT